MADITNLTQFLGDIAEAIRTKKESSESIPAASFDSEILSIETGINTDDATATEDDVISPKTFYAQGEKKTGGILAEYAHLDTSAAVYNRQVTSSNNIAISTPYNILVEWVSSYVYFYKINADNTLTQLTRYSCSFNTFHTISIAQTLINNNELVVWVGGIGRVQNVYRMGRLYCLYFNMDTYAITSASLDLSSDIAPYHIVINPANPNIMAGMNGYSYTNSYLSYRCLNKSTISGTGLYGKMNAYYDAEWSSDGKYLLAYTSGVKPGASKSLFTCDPTASTVSTSGTSKSYNPMCLYDDKYYITKTAFRSLTTNALVKSITEIPNATFLWTWKNVLFAHDGSDLSAYLINNDLSLTLITTLQSVGSISSSTSVSVLRPMSNESGWFKIGSLLYMCDVKEGEYAITKAIIKDRDYVLLPASLDNTTSADVLNNKAFINSNGLQYGTMPNCGAMTYTPSTTSQTIAKGYHNGSTINAVTSSIDSDIKAKNIKQGVEILGVSGILANCITFSTIEEMNAYAGEEDMYAIVYGTSYVGTYRYDNGSWTQIGDSSQEQQIMDVLNEIADTSDQYEGTGGTDEEISIVLDEVMGVTPYVPLNYIQSSGEQYINTNIPMSENLIIDIEYELDELATEQCILGESEAGWNVYGSGFCGNATSFGVAYNNLQLVGGLESNGYTPIDAIDARITLTITNDYIVYNGTTISVNADRVALQNAGGVLWLLKCGAWNESASAKIYNLRVSSAETGELIMNLVPAKTKNTNEICMYDTITKTFFRNDGAGEFSEI